jgi:hypothetical protein
MQEQIMIKKFVIILLVSGLALSACATKRYGRMQPLSEVEKQNYTCREIAIEISKVEAFQKQVTDGTKTNTKSIAGVIGDLGIGNTQEKHAARRTANGRLKELQALSAGKNCAA